MEIALFSLTLYWRAAYVQGYYRVYDFDQNQVSQMVSEHNRLRALEPATNMQEIVWDWNLASLSRDWAGRCMATHRSGGDRSNRAGYTMVGENIWWSNEPYLRSDLGSIVRSFYDEKWYYSFNNGWCANGQDCGHYTQVVWATSCAVGCAAAYCDNIMYGRGIRSGHIVVCNYGPAGNWIGRQPYVYGQQCAACPGQCRNGLCPSQCSGNPAPAAVAPPPPPAPRPAPALPPPPPPPPSRPAAPPAPPKTPVAPVPALKLKPNRPAQCVDRHSLCSFWATINECTTNQFWMRNNCYGSCNQFECSGVVANTAPECDDASPFCSQWATMGECGKNGFYMNWQCRKSCGVCS